MSATETVIAPDVGAIVEYGLDSFGRKPQTWRVKGWMCTAERPKFAEDDWIGEILFDSCREFKGNKRLRWCLREEAEYVTLTSICGAVAPIGECKVIGMVNWPKDQIDKDRDRAIRLGMSRELLF
jgi:hypothetical protein